MIRSEKGREIHFKTFGENKRDYLCIPVNYSWDIYRELNHESRPQMCWICCLFSYSYSRIQKGGKKRKEL